MQIPISTPTDVKVQAQMYWLSATSPGSLEATTIELPLSADPVERSKQLLIALNCGRSTPNQRTMPPDAVIAGVLPPSLMAQPSRIFSDALSAEIRPEFRMSNWSWIPSRRRLVQT